MSGLSLYILTRVKNGQKTKLAMPTCTSILIYLDSNKSG